MSKYVETHRQVMFAVHVERKVGTVILDLCLCLFVLLGLLFYFFWVGSVVFEAYILLQMV